MGFRNNSSVVVLGSGTLSLRSPGGEWIPIGNAPEMRVFPDANDFQAHLRAESLSSPYRKALLAEMRRIERKCGGAMWKAKRSARFRWEKLNLYYHRCA